MKRIIAVALFAFVSGSAFAEAQYGVEVYPGAKADEQVAKQVKDKLKITAKTYRTSDPVSKVTDFYRKQNLTEAHASKKGATFTSKAGATVTIQSPWLDMDSGKMNNDTLVSIVAK
jgi:hypothetical protein